MALRQFRSDITTYSLDHIPFRFLDDIGWYRNLADAETPRRLRGIFDRHASILTDRRKLTAMLLWDR